MTQNNNISINSMAAKAVNPHIGIQKQPWIRGRPRPTA